jgi:hypothetical protein
MLPPNGDWAFLFLVSSIGQIEDSRRGNSTYLPLWFPSAQLEEKTAFCFQDMGRHFPKLQSRDD